MLKFRHTAIAAALLSVSLGSTALTLGRVRGVALISQPLDISVEVRLDSGEDAASQCFEGDVFYGDSRVESSRVSIALERSANGVDGLVRIRSSAPVDEPVLSFYLRAGCVQRSTRRYVVLAEMASEPAGLQGSGRALPPGAFTAPAGGALALPSGSGPAGAMLPALPADSRPRGPRRPRAQDGVQPPAAASATGSPRRSQVEAAPRGSRLRLDMLDLAAEREPTLRSSSELLTAPVENAQRRAEAAAMWRAINAQPAEVLRDAQRVVTLENDVRSLRDSVGKEQARLGAMRAQLDKAESERYLNWLVYLLAALLLAAIAAGVYFWRRSQGQVVLSQDWWRAGDKEPGDEPALAPEPRRGVVASPAKGTEVDIDLDADVSMLDTVKSANAVTPVPRAEQFDFVPSVAGSSRNVNAEELFDIQQQADFFVSLGQYDQAIEVLKNHISDNVETSALAYLDLLKIYHTLGRRDEYEGLRQDFNAVFNAQVPVFESFSDTGSGLDAYPNAMARIEALWPSQKVLEIIEESLFRKPGSEGEAFDLEAYRELLLLYAMAKDVVERGGSSMDFELSSSPHEDDAGPASFAATQVMAAYAAGNEEQPPTIPVDLPALPQTEDVTIDFDGSVVPTPKRAAEEPEEMEFTVEDAEPDARAGEGDPSEPAATAPPADGALMEFDLFDPDVEKEIAPKKPAR